MHCKIFTWGELSLPEEILPEENTQLAEIIMVHPGGFEPPTARFVAEYSIQLSYGCSDNSCITQGAKNSPFTTFLNATLEWCIREDSNLRPLGS
jgi:hypothetical protein